MPNWVVFCWFRRSASIANGLAVLGIGLEAGRRAGVLFWMIISADGVGLFILVDLGFRAASAAPTDTVPIRCSGQT